jgi:hypothetical protein
MRGTPTIISCHPELAIPVRPTPAARQSARGTQPTGCALRERENARWKLPGAGPAAGVGL